MRNYHLITLGCQMNKSDGERVRTVLDGLGYSYVDNEEEANILGILACSVRQKAIDKVYSRIHKWNKLKNRKNLVTFISGCVLPADHEKFLKLFDIVFAMHELPEFPDMLSQYGIVTPASLEINRDSKLFENQKNEPEIQEDDFKPLVTNNNHSVVNTGSYMKQFWNVRPSYTSSYEAFVPIQNGCDKFCTFCAVPYTRGREVSRPSVEILDEVKNLVENNYKSITLLGQNVNSYGKDRHGAEIGFPELLQQIGEFGDKSGKNFWVYFTSPHPWDMTNDVIDVIYKYSCLAKQIHLPIQSGDNKVLIRMNRKHDVAKYRHIIHYIWKKIPQATIFTDIIVGFTGETDDQFENTRKVMEEFKYNMAYIAKYSPRPGAKSSRWDDDIPNEVKKERLQILTEELTKHTLVKNREMIGNTYKVLVTGKDRKKGFLSGLTEGKIIVRFASKNEHLIGNFVNVKIQSVTEFATEGDLQGVEEYQMV